MKFRFALLLGVGLLGGCKAVPQVVGVSSGLVAGTATGNPAVGFGVAVAVNAAADAGVKYFGRARQGAEQDEIATAAGALSEGGHAAWAIHHTIPIGNEHGELTVVRAIETPLALCKEIVFSVDSGSPPEHAWYDAEICLQNRQWKWASAEPAVDRWGALQ